ncbi:MAG TPA: PilZ domain-containing protein [Acidimicrobiales bacterium]|nr:PilZ domain-containing protein [Acidimicrobiales bacterium]
MVDRRLPQPGQAVTVNAPGIRFALRHFRVVSANSLDLRIEADDILPHLPPVTPLVLTMLGHRTRFEGAVIDRLGETGLEVRLRPLPERRMGRRVELALVVEIDPFGRGNRTTIRCLTRDLSEGGLRLSSPEPLKAGRRAVVTIRPANEAAIYAMVEILESRPDGDGRHEARLKFTSLPADGLAGLRHVLARADAADTRTLDAALA